METVVGRQEAGFLENRFVRGNVFGGEDAELLDG